MLEMYGSSMFNAYIVFLVCAHIERGVKCVMALYCTYMVSRVIIQYFLNLLLHSANEIGKGLLHQLLILVSYQRQTLQRLDMHSDKNQNNE
mmetsp:Transcript_36170/g.47858  ORF Transcript_36170/g.47858 Transcript_36170/m.47858 type:complete len:91 (-) Transcript_36170:2-274(-)